MCLVAVAVVAGCGGPEKANTDTPPKAAAPAKASTKPAATAQAKPAADTSQSEILGRVRVVDLEGRELPGMIPIVTTEPNAFHEPVAKGSPTTDDGKGTVLIPKDRAYYVRAWDPKLRLFANNFFTVQPDAGPKTDVMQVVMVPAATLLVKVRQPDSKPAADQIVDLMLIHPTQGPWWPARIRTDGSGSALFAHLPPGKFKAQFKSEKGATAFVDGLSLPPGEITNGGVISLH